MKRIGRPTIRDVATAAGVSLTTVSDALSGKGRLPGETRARIEGIARQLNYRPNAMARGLRGRNLGLIGISIAPAQAATLSSVWYWTSITTHASEMIMDEGFAPVLLPHDSERLTKLSIPLDGAIVVDPLDHDEVLAFLRRQRVGTVTIGRDSSDPQGPWIDEDIENGILELLGRTVEPGQKLAAITLGPRKSYALDTLKGAERWAQRTNSMVSEFHCDTADDGTIDSALAQARRSGAEILLAQNDRLASKILARLRTAGVRVPHDVRLISATDAPDLEDTEPPITSLRQYPKRLAKLAVRTLFAVLHGTAIKEYQLLAADMAVRESAPALRSWPRAAITAPELKTSAKRLKVR